MSKILKSIFLCVKYLQLNKVIIHPTEGFFGLGCNPDNYKAIKKIIILKKRAFNKGFILIAHSYELLRPYISEKKITFSMKNKFLNKTFDFITYLVPSNPHNPSWINGGSDLIAVRLTNHNILKKLCFLFGKPIISTSANLSGLKPCKSLKEIIQFFGNKIPILSHTLGKKKKSSKILNLMTGKVIRE
ncbi:Sua5/YciO/YrdC/YwlC family protein [Buchnera aphidicola]|uniref:Sua5/YciO/YrdC/YwlC family protein n=1 Tax=Buchnera aphidicola TaxID=9 RepID=UPI0030EE128F